MEIQAFVKSLEILSSNQIYALAENSSRSVELKLLIVVILVIISSTVIVIAWKRGNECGDSKLNEAYPQFCRRCCEL